MLLCKSCKRNGPYPFICLDCQETIDGYCELCYIVHATKKHNRRKVNLGRICPYCNKLTKAAPPNKLQAYYWALIERKGYAKTGRELDRPDQTIRRWCDEVKIVYSFCQNSECGKRIIPTPKDYRVVYLYSFYGVHKKNTIARMLNIPTEQVRKSLCDYKKIHNLTNKELRSWVFVSGTGISIKLTYTGGTKELELAASKPRNVARHPIGGYGYQKEPEGGPIVPGTDFEDGIRKRYRELRGRK